MDKMNKAESFDTFYSGLNLRKELSCLHLFYVDVKILLLQGQFLFRNYLTKHFAE